MPRFFAHSPPPAFPDRWEPLAQHLREVAAKAGELARFFGAQAEAEAAGLLHDLGKYGERFQKRLRGQESGLDHWSAGAWAALHTLGPQAGAAAWVILGHHVGLRSFAEVLQVRKAADLERRHPQRLRLTDSDFPALLARLEADGLAPPPVPQSLFDFHGPHSTAGMLDVRMLFSALVDADYLKTEAHFEQGPAGPREREPGPPLRAGEALDLVLAELARLAARGASSPAVAALRQDLLAACRRGAEDPPGLFTLSAPTGSGKTLAMLAFALRHAERHGLRRVVLAVPYLSIIEQTAAVYRGLFEPVFGPDYVLEHHSLAGTRGEGATAGEEGSDEQQGAALRARLLAENWDAPLVVTTTVQLLESLFAGRPSACRKLHQLSRSVLLFDEVQTLPLHLAVPTLAALSHLAEPRFGSTVVFATATQPAFGTLGARVGEQSPRGWKPSEIAPRSLGLFDRVRRVAYRFDLDRRRSWDDLAAEIAEQPQALCILNLKRHARLLTEALERRGLPRVVHLSTHLCPAHRRKVLAEVRSRVGPGLDEPCLLASTQCVEAGVDLDFPVVFRALGPLESIAQAAGRCNRNGLREGGGSMVVFEPEDDRFPGDDYARAAGVARDLLREFPEFRAWPESPEVFASYYGRLYGLQGVAGGLMEKEAKLAEALKARDFEAVAESYRLIPDGGINILVPYEPDVFAALRARLHDTGRLTRDWIRAARAHTVSLFRPQRNDPFRSALAPAPLGRGRGDSEEWFVLEDPQLYDRERLGLRVEEPFLLV